MEGNSLRNLLNLLRCKVLDLWVSISLFKLLKKLLFANELTEKGQLLVDFVYFQFSLLHFVRVEVDDLLVILENYVRIVMHHQLLLLKLLLRQLLLIFGHAITLLVYLLHQLLLGLWLLRVRLIRLFFLLRCQFVFCFILTVDDLSYIILNSVLFTALC